MVTNWKVFASFSFGLVTVTFVTVTIPMISTLVLLFIK